MSKDAFDFWVNNPENETEENECAICGASIDENKIYCSASCARADER